MEAVRQWAFGLCAAAVACALAQLVLPGAGMQRVFRITYSVFFLCCLLSPVALAPGDLRLAAGRQAVLGQVEARSQQLEASLQASALALARENLRLAAGEKLAQLGVEGGKISVDVHAQGEGGISISGCELRLPEGYADRAQEIEVALEAYLGVPVGIGWEKEEVYG